jgi:recombination protein RecT
MTTTDVVRQTPKQKTLADLINKMQPEIAKALPRHISPDRMARIASSLWCARMPALARCTPESFLGALLTASQLGLEAGPTGEAYFVPYGQVCTFIPGYRGLIKLARQSGQVSDIYAEIVYENDEFDVTLGLHRNLDSSRWSTGPIAATRPTSTPWRSSRMAPTRSSR